MRARLKAWTGFRDVAYATRSLAAAQQLRWSAHERRALEHLSWAHTLAQRHPDTRPPGTWVVVGIGTDLGLCGRLNQQLADALTGALASRVPARCVVVGQRLDDALLPGLPRQVEPAPASFEALEALTARLEAEVLTATGRGRSPRLLLVYTSSVSGEGTANVRALEEVSPTSPARSQDLAAQLDRQEALLSAPAELAREASGLLLHARLVHALCRASWSEAAARLAVMGRAHEQAQERIAEQELALVKARQEQITQEMLEVTRPRE
jgi:F0F1-type ATP synthase gamma subunit